MKTIFLTGGTAARQGKPYLSKNISDRRQA